MFDVITVGSATIDIFVKADFLKKKEDYLCMHYGSKFDIENPFLQIGGGATNTSVSFSRLGLKTAIITKVGNDDSGHNIKRILNNEKVSTIFITTDKDFGTATSVIIYKEGLDRTVFVYRGASENINVKDINFKDLKTKWLHITALRDNSIKMLKELLNYSHKNNIKIAMNPGSKELEIKSLFKYVDILLLNKEEAEKLSEELDIKKIIKKLSKLGPKTIVITNGREKLYVYNNNYLYSTRPYNVKIVNTLGAGDAFCSSFVASLIKNSSIEEAIKYGLINSSSVIQHSGAKTGLLYYKGIKNYEYKLKQELNIHKEEMYL